MICEDEGDVIKMEKLDKKREKLEEKFSPLLQHDPTMERTWFKYIQRIKINIV